MIAISNAVHLKNLKAETETKDWKAIPIANSIPDNSDAGAPCHIYLTKEGIIFWRPATSVIFPISELKALVKSVSNDFASPPPAPAKPIKSEPK